MIASIYLTVANEVPFSENSRQLDTQSDMQKVWPKLSFYYSLLSFTELFNLLQVWVIKSFSCNC